LIFRETRAQDATKVTATSVAKPPEYRAGPRLAGVEIRKSAAERDRFDGGTEFPIQCELCDVADRADRRRHARQPMPSILPA
jgi:hypothetical protein